MDFVYEIHFTIADDEMVLRNEEKPVFLKNRKSEIIQVFLECILCRQAGVGQVALFPVPLLQFAVIEHFYAVLNNKEHDVVFQTFLEHNKPTDTSIAILKGVNAFKSHMERKDIFKRHLFLAVIRIEQPFHLRRYFLGQGRFLLADLIWQFFYNRRRQNNLSLRRLFRFSE